MYDLNHLQNLIEIIEEPENRACFKSMLKSCELAEFITVILYNNGAIGENEKLNLLTRISTAKTKAIDAHKQAIKKTVNGWQIVGTLDSFIDFIYKDIFGD